MRMSWLLSAAVVLAITSAGLAQTQVTVSLEAINPRPVPDSNLIRIEIINHGANRAVAWALDTTYVFADGHSVRLLTDEDCYPQLALPTVSVETKPIAPGESTSMTIGGTGELPISIDARVVAAVFEDRTSEGNQGRIAKIFQKRAEDAESWRSVLAALSVALQRHALSRQTLEAITDEVRAPAVPDKDRTIRQNVLNNLRLLRSEVDDASLPRRMTQLLDSFERQRQVALDGSRPR